MWPVALVLSTLAELEKREMGRRIATGYGRGTLRTVKEFRTAAGAVWLATLILAIAVLMWFPRLILEHGCENSQAPVVLAFSGPIMPVRVARTPDSVLLQAAGRFHLLAAASGWSYTTSLIVTLLLMLGVDSVVSLGGVLIGKRLMSGRFCSLSRHWNLAHG
jgi:hypothetical protein